MTKFLRIAPFAAVALAACSGQPEPAPLNEGAAVNTTETLPDVAPPPEAAPPPADNATATATPGEVPPAVDPTGIDPSGQVLDDAAASGMTARIPDSADAEPANTEALR